MKFYNGIINIFALQEDKKAEDKVLKTQSRTQHFVFFFVFLEGKDINCAIVEINFSLSSRGVEPGGG